MQNLLGNLRYAAATVPPVARLHRCSRTHAGAGHRRHHRNLQLDPRGDAPLLTGFRSRACSTASAKATTAASKAVLQDRWGMFSFPLYERLKAETPEFEEVTAFQAGGTRMSVRREGVESVAQASALRIRHRQLFLHARRARVRRARCLPRPMTTKPLRLPLLSSAIVSGKPPTVQTVRSSARPSIVEGHPFTVIGIAPAGFFGETLHSDPPDIWIPVAAGTDDRW